MKLFEVGYSLSTGNFFIKMLGKNELNVFDKTIFLLEKADILIKPIMDIKGDVDIQLDGEDDPILFSGSEDQNGAYIYMSLGLIYKANGNISDYQYINPFWKYLYRLPEGDYALEYQGQIRNYLIIEGTDRMLLYPWEYKKYIQAIRNKLFI